MGCQRGAGRAWDVSDMRNAGGQDSSQDAARQGSVLLSTRRYLRICAECIPLFKDSGCLMHGTFLVV